jgi:hypothetical protein
MAGKNWQIEGKWAEFCNCNYGCPCETMAEPTYGFCTGLVAFKIDNGWCEDVRLDDLAVAATPPADRRSVRCRLPADGRQDQCDLCRYRHKGHNADYRIMPHRPVVIIGTPTEVRAGAA